MADLIILPDIVLDGNGNPVPGPQAFFDVSGTNMPVTVYADQSVSVAHPSPLIGDAEGVLPQPFYEGTENIKVTITDADGVVLPGYPKDPIPKISTTNSGAGQTSFAPTVRIPQTNVQAAIVAVDAKIGDPTEAGTALVEAADAAAQRTILSINNVDNTSDANKPVSVAQQAAIDAAVGTRIFNEDVTGAALVEVTLPLAEYDHFEIVISNLVPGTDATSLHLRTSSDGTTFDAGASDYQTAVTGSSTTTAAQIDLDFGALIGSDTDEPGTSGRVTIFNPGDTGKKTMMTGNMAFVSSAGGLVARPFSAMRDSVGEVVAIQLSYSSGVIETGNIQVFGVR